MKDLRFILLLDFYRNMLSDKQADLMDLYYNEDLSLAEISENMGITRQGVRDHLKRAEAQLLNLETKLGLAARYSKMQTVTAQLLSQLMLLEQAAQNNNTQWVGEHIEKMKQLLSTMEE